jgi:hypothetical protein
MAPGQVEDPVGPMQAVESNPASVRAHMKGNFRAVVVGFPCRNYRWIFRLSLPQPAQGIAYEGRATFELD